MPRMFLAGSVPDALTGILVYFQGREASPKRRGGGSPGLPVLVLFKGGQGRQRVVRRMKDQAGVQFSLSPRRIRSANIVVMCHQCGRKLTKNENRSGLRSSMFDPAPLTARRKLTRGAAVTIRMIVPVAIRLWIGNGRVSS